MTPEQLRAVVRPTNTDVARDAAAGINAACARWDIQTTADQAAFAAQVSHETGGFMAWTENLNYDVAGLLRVWPRRFTPELARQYGRIDGVQKANQQMIANVAYANRMGNGSIESGDGWRYRGRGPGITGRDNYLQAGKAIGLNLIECPDQLAQIGIGCQAFGWFWKVHKLSALANQIQLVSGKLPSNGPTDKISIAVNGGTLGLDDRRNLTENFLKVLNVPLAA